MSEEGIIDCGGKYEVHPLPGSGWAVVNGDTGGVRCSYADQESAVKEAKRLNGYSVNRPSYW